MQCAIPRGAPHAPAALALIVAAILVGACSKGEPQSEKPRPNAPVQIPQAKSEAPAIGGDVDAALKERLARQEAASKLFEKPAPPPPAKPPEKAAPPQKPPEPPKSEPKPAPPPQPVVASLPATPPPVAPPQPKAEPPPPQRQEVAAVRAAPAPAPEPTRPRLITRVDPEFPREATQSGVEEGLVKARMTLDGGGNVTRVEVVESRPRRVFDRAVVRALSQWKYSEGASGRTVEMEVAFKR